MDCDRCRDRAVPPPDLFEAHENIVRAAYELVRELRMDGEHWRRTESKALALLVRDVLADIKRTG